MVGVRCSFFFVCFVDRGMELRAWVSLVIKPTMCSGQTEDLQLELGGERNPRMPAEEWKVRKHIFSYLVVCFVRLTKQQEILAKECHLAHQGLYRCLFGFLLRLHIRNFN